MNLSHFSNTKAQILKRHGVLFPEERSVVGIKAEEERSFLLYFGHTAC